MSEAMIRIGITQGDINGIGYEVIIKTLLDQRILDLCTPVIYGSPKIAAYHRKALNIDNFSPNLIQSATEAAGKRISIINCVGDEVRVELGKSTQSAGEASFLALSRAAEDLKAGHIGALVTAPVNKNNMQSDRFRFNGQTEFLRDFFEAGDVLMMMVSEVFKVAVVTGHIPLQEVPSALSIELIMNKIRLLERSLHVDFRIRKPRIAVLGLNPHAGEEGLLGSEDREVILPAIEQAREEDIIAFGPFPADGYFGSGDFSKFDATLAMYHDQGLVPFKSISFHEGVQYTAGLPVVRTSPAHGTAFEIAGKDVARNESFRQALFTACDIFRNRGLESEISSNPLKAGDLTDLW